MINFEEFIQQYYYDVDDAKKAWIKLFLTNVDELSNGENVIDLLKNKLLVCKTFFIRKTGGVSRPHYYKIKKVLIDLANYLGINIEIPSRDDVMSTQCIFSYFEDLNDLIGFIDEMGAKNMSEYNKKIDLCSLKALSILGWHGLTPEQISKIKKNDCIFGVDSNTIRNDDVDIRLNKNEAAIISVLTNESCRRGYPSGKMVYYKGGFEYLFKATTPSAIVPLDRITLLHLMIRFNEENNSLRVLHFGTLKKNAAFVDIYNDKREITLSQKIIERLKCDRILALGISKEYKKWVETFKK